MLAEEEQTDLGRHTRSPVERPSTQRQCDPETHRSNTCLQRCIIRGCLRTAASAKSLTAELTDSHVLHGVSKSLDSGELEGAGYSPRVHRFDGSLPPFVKTVIGQCSARTSEATPYTPPGDCLCETHHTAGGQAHWSLLRPPWPGYEAQAPR